MTTPTTAENNDASPSWEEATPALIAIIRDNEAPDEQKAAAWTELRRMARLADRMKEFVPALNLAFQTMRDTQIEFRRFVRDTEGSIDLDVDLTDAIKAVDAVLSGSSAPAEEPTSNVITL